MDLNKLSAYSLVEKKELKEIEGYGYVLCHNKTKARVLVVENNDNNKVFTIGFRTPPADDTGVAHITEHSVLCGSKNFPVKDPFVELCKGSLNTFLNAMTYSDKTVYPIASLNSKDFHNLMHVYLDAVFYPNIYDKKEIMMQEGWHYEIDEETGRLKYNGVVFNEMKGVYSNPEQQLYRDIESSLLPDTAYGYESGGDPVYITDLTQEDFLAFHSKYYHPSNSYIYLYGDMDSVKELDFIDKEYLSKYDYLEIDSVLQEQKCFEKPSYKTDFYSLADAEDEKDNAYLTYNFIVGKSTDKLLCMAFSVLERALIQVPGAPLKKALVDAGIGKDVFSSYDDGIMQPTFSIIAKNANEEDEQRFIDIIEGCISKLCEEGINKKSLLAAINYFEFKHKESNFGRYPKGLMLGLNAFGSWLYDDTCALTLFEMNEVFDLLKEKLKSRYFEELLEKYVLNNTHKSFVKLLPKKGLNALREKEESEKCDRYFRTLSPAEVETIKEEAKKLKEYQESEDSKEALMTIPLLEISDIDKNAKKIKNDFSTVEQIKLVGHDIFTNGISYLSLNFDITDIDCRYYKTASLLTEIFKYVDTEKYSYNELSNEINIHTGGIGFTTSVINKKELGEYYVHFIVNAKMLDGSVDKAMELVDEILFTSRIDDRKRLKEIIAETRSNMKNDLVSSGHMTAAGRAVSYVSGLGAAKELIDGVDYYKYLAALDDDFDNQYDALVSDLKDTLAQILTRDGLVISYTGKNKPEIILKESVTKLSKKLSARPKFDSVNRCIAKKKNEGFKTSSQVQYVAAAGNFREKGLAFTGALTVLSTIFSYDYLWINVRVKGGAYGSMCSFSRSGNSYLTSYRDPNLMETYEIYKNAPAYVRSFDCDERDMTKYIIGAISKMDTPFTPSSEGNFSFAAWLMGLTDEDLQRERDEVLGTDVSVIRGLADYVQSIIDSGTICAIGDENKLDKAKENFMVTESVF